MIKYLIKTLIICTLFVSNMFAQKPIDPQNCREGEGVEYCHEHTRFNELLKNSEFKKQWDKDQAQVALENVQMKSKTKGEIPGKGVVYKIPVVFHVLHADGAENISKAQILNAMQILNRDYRLLNADANNVYAPFIGMPADIEIEFVLATKAPNGDCFSGITRTRNAITSDGSDGVAQVDAIVAGNDVYNGEWPGNKYMNIFVCKEIGGAAGYTYRPSSWIGSDMRNGIWVLQNYVGSIGTGDENRSRTLTHEVGHWLNLAHVWGSSNNPGLASNCSPGMDDEVDDTPETIGNTICSLAANTCSLDNAYWGFDQVDPIENYMNYSYCSKMFTTGQAVRMRTALLSNIGGRSNLSTPANLAATGANGTLTLCKAEFSVKNDHVCQGENVVFEDQSFNSISGWSWNFPGGSPATSTSQNPVVTYANPGTYTVELSVTDGTTNLTQTKTNFITVYAAGTLIPYSEGFESYTTLSSPSSFWRATSTSGTTSFEVTNLAASQGSKSVRLRNYNLPAGTYSELLSNPFDLSALPSSQVVTFSFKYAHSKRSGTDLETLKFQLSTNCGETWSIRKTLLSNTLSTRVNASEWTPNLEDWVQVHVLGVNSGYFVPNLLSKFTFQSDGGNNLYIDDINLYKGGPESLTLAELGEVQNVMIYPNPAESDINIGFNVNQNSDVLLKICDVMGKQVRAERIQASSGENVIIMDTDHLASGLYFMNIQMGNSTKTVQFAIN